MSSLRTDEVIREFIFDAPEWIATRCAIRDVWPNYFGKFTLMSSRSVNTLIGA